MNTTPTVLHLLPAIHFIQVTGADAEVFLNAQLSQNIASKGTNRVTLAAWHDSKGRVLGLLHTFPHDDGWLLMVHGDNPESLTQKLKLFVLRDDIEIYDVSSKWFGAVLLGKNAHWFQGCNKPLDQASENIVKKGAALVFKLSPHAIYLVAPKDKQHSIESEFEVSNGLAGEIAEIQMGLINISSTLRQRFTPQMLNLDKLGALSFNKGCYPGQEVIARVHHRGNLKRRIFRFSGVLSDTPSIGSVLLDLTGAPVGEVVRSARADIQRVELLAIIRIDAAEKHLELAEEPQKRLTREPLPWETL